MNNTQRKNRRKKRSWVWLFPPKNFISIALLVLNGKEGNWRTMWFLLPLQSVVVFSNLTVRCWDVAKQFTWLVFILLAIVELLESVGLYFSSNFKVFKPIFINVPYVPLKNKVHSLLSEKIETGIPHFNVLCFTAICRCFHKIKVCASTVSNKSIGAIFFNTICLLHILTIRMIVFHYCCIIISFIQIFHHYLLW